MVSTEFIVKGWCGPSPTFRVDVGGVGWWGPSIQHSLSVTVVLVFCVFWEEEVGTVVVAAVLKNPVPCSEMASGRAERAQRLAAPFVSVTDRYRYGRPDLLIITAKGRENTQRYG